MECGLLLPRKAVTDTKENGRLHSMFGMETCPVCGSDQDHGDGCGATRLIKTLARVGGGVRKEEIPVFDATFLKACGIEHYWACRRENAFLP
jgi:hypothetical protein